MRLKGGREMSAFMLGTAVNYSLRAFMLAAGVAALSFGAAAIWQRSAPSEPSRSPVPGRSATAKGPRPQGTVTSVSRSLVLPEAVPADAHLKGMWSAVKDWPLIGIHLVLLPDGRVLSYGTDGLGAQTGYFIYDVWAPALGFGLDAHLTLPNLSSTNIFCNAQLLLPQPDAGVLMLGGSRWNDDKTIHLGNYRSLQFSYLTNLLKRKADMQRQRYYASATTLPNGEVYIQGGTSGEDHPEVRAVDGSFRLLGGIDTGTFHPYYPRNFVAPDGRVFGWELGSGKMYYVDPGGAGSLALHGEMDASHQGLWGSAAMYRPGRILYVAEHSKIPLVVDVHSGQAPEIRSTDPIYTLRSTVNSTLLADGRVLLTGGSGVYNELVDVAYAAEIWDPESGTWRAGASNAIPRLYHSTALLLPDATVLVAGGGATGPLTNLNAEIYYPPYLFNSSGERAQRPQITAAPSTLAVGKSFGLDFSHPESIRKLSLVKTGSVTHDWNMDQRYVDLPFSASGNHLRIQMPSQPGQVPPGYYMLFLIDDKGVPSMAKIVFVNVAGQGPLAGAPTLQNPGDRTDLVGAAARIDLSATDPDGDMLSYSASGLPPGLSIDSVTGRISGSPGVAGTYSTMVAVTDGTFSSSIDFNWTVAGGESIELASLPVLAPTLAGDPATFRAAAGGAGVQYRWDFGDGSPLTQWSGSGVVSHVFQTAGVYFVTAFASRADGSRTQVGTLHVVHLPLTAGRPTQSSNLAYESRAAAGARVWLVNQDNDSVSVFDAASGVRLAEIAVQSAPRSVAIAADGRVWVTNKRSASISVIDPVTLTVVNTLKLARASQPHGIAMSANGARAYVSLEALGKLLTLRTSDFRTLGTSDVGPHPRGVSVSGNGATAYVSRFITPPQPGESTATVGTLRDGLPTGGEIVHVRLSDGLVERKTVLGHSSRADSESQGRGVPNYLSAAALSPDGTQAWVPSKQDNIQRGVLRDGNPLNFQNTVRAIVSRVDLASGLEVAAHRMDLDNSSYAGAAVFDPLGVVLFVALETSREVAVIDAHRRRELFRFEVGRTPQGLALSTDGLTLYVNNFMDRTLGVFDLRPMFGQGQLKADPIATSPAVETEKLAAWVLRGKQLFYDARDPRLAADRYMSCAGCHDDGGHDGRVWDLTGFGEGLRNTVSLRGRKGAQGFLHWSNNFDEVQDFEGQIRNLAGGLGLMEDADLAQGTRSQPLGTPKAGISADLDALAAYVQSLDSFDPSPFRKANGALSEGAVLGKAVFERKACVTCHAGAAFTASGANTLVDVGTVRPESGSRLGEALIGIDVPTLRDVWATPPYLHDGSAPTLDAAVMAHQQLALSSGELSNLVSYLQSIGQEEAAPKIPAGTGVGLKGIYYNNPTLIEPSALTRTEAVNFSWSYSPATGINADRFSVRWTGTLVPPTTGSYRFRTDSADGVRLLVNGSLVIDHWTAHSKHVLDTSAIINLEAGRAYPIVMEYYDLGGTAVAKLQWLTPAATAYGAIGADRLFPQ